MRAVPSVGAESELLTVGCASSFIYISPTVRPVRVAVWYLIETFHVAAEAIALGATPTLMVCGVSFNMVLSLSCDHRYVHGFILTSEL